MNRGPTSRPPSSCGSPSAQRKNNAALSFTVPHPVFLCGMCSSTPILRETVPRTTDRGPCPNYRRGTTRTPPASSPRASPLRVSSISPRYGHTTSVPIDEDVCRGTSRRDQRLVRRTTFRAAIRFARACRHANRSCKREERDAHVERPGVLADREEEAGKESLRTTVLGAECRRLNGSALRARVERSVRDPIECTSKLEGCACRDR